MAVGPTINSDDLEVYAQRQEAAADIADLVRYLVSSSVSGATSSVRFRSGQGNRLGGYDGIVQSASGGLQVPAGASVWELSAREDYETKANQDYDARKNDPQGVDTSKTTYVAVTMRKWPGKETWAREKKKDGVWADVIALDSGDLATWLSQAPAVEAWFRRHSGLQPIGTSDAEGFLTSWQEATVPPLSSELLLLNREECSKELRLWLAGSPSSVILRGDSVDEVTAFVCASIQQLDESTRQQFLSRTVIVRDGEAFRQLVNQKGNLLLIPIFSEYTGSLEAVKKGHHLLIPKDPGAPAAGTELVLPHQKAEALSTYLKKIGLTEDQAEQLAARSDGRIAILRRLLGFAETPAWATSKHARELIPFLLLGKWKPGMSGDSEITERYFGIKAEDFEAKLLEWKKSPDSPVQQSGYTWEWRSRYEGWKLLSSSISDQDLKKFGELAKEVLSEKDPAIELSQEEQWTAGIRGKARKYSEELRKGISETLALLSSANQTMEQVRNHSPEALSSGIVSSVLGTHWTVWAGSKEILPNLAEASPNSFFLRLEESIKDKNGVTMLFSQKRDAFFGGIPQAGVLWALETLAWEPNLLGRVCQILAQLHECDRPENNIGNKPIRSLGEILCPWHPQTFASVQDRVKVLRAITKAAPKVGWEIAKTFIPHDGGIATRTHPLTWREPFASQTKPKATMADLGYFVTEVAGILISMAHADGARWSELVDIIERFPEEKQRQLLTEIKGALGTLGVESKRSLRESLRDFLHRTRAYPDARWTSKNKDIVDEAEGIFSKLVPSDLVDEHFWLFDGWPKFTEVEPREFEERRVFIGERRSAALRDIIQKGGDASTLLRLIERSDQAHAIGDGFAALDLKEKEKIEEDLMKIDPVRSNEVSTFFSAWIYRRQTLIGRSWIKPYVEKLMSEKNEDAVVLVLTSLPCDQEVWKLAEAQGSEVFKKYWKRTQIFSAWDTWDEAQRLLPHLLEAGRASDVACILSEHICAKRGKSKLALKEAMEALNKLTDCIARLEGPIEDPGMLGFYLGEIFKAVEGDKDHNPDELAMLEWRLFPIFEYSPNSTKNLFKLVEKNPELFADLVGFIYKKEREENSSDEEDSEENPESAEFVRLRATRAYSLIDQHWKGFPGRGENGQLSREKLITWLAQARKKLSELKRVTIGESEIGKILSRSPVGKDGHWPAEVVRDVLEESKSTDLERGFFFGVINGRGVTMRGLHDGGKQERELSDKYEKWSTALASESPRTSAVLHSLAENYRNDARREDLNSEKYD